MKINDNREYYILRPVREAEWFALGTGRSALKLKGFDIKVMEYDVR